jgi:hypothetical protein
VYSNFLNPATRYPTAQSIQRLLLDILASNDIGDLTDGIFKYRMLLLPPATGKTEYKLGTMEGDKTFSFSTANIAYARKQASRLIDRTICGDERFPRTDKKVRCSICYIRSSCHS